MNRQYPFASGILWVGGSAFLVLYALPLLLFPLRWAQWFQWTIPTEVELAVYFGRCLGGLGVVITLLALHAAWQPARHQHVFKIIALVSGIMTGIHVWGAIGRTNPWPETLEIGLYALMTALPLLALRTLRSA